MVRDIRIVVIGKANLLRDGIWALLRAQVGMDVLGAVESDPEAIGSFAPSSPDVAVMNLPVVTRGGLDVIRSARKRWLGVHIVILTAQVDDSVVNAVTHAAIEGCLLASDSHTELISAIRSVSIGKRYLTPLVAEQMEGGPHRLTKREQEVMRLIAAGYRTREIAHQLSLSRKTIEKYRGSLMRKLGLRSATAVAAYAIAHGYWTP
jgi:two-component system, NarL family, response regulator NreC